MEKILSIEENHRRERIIEEFNNDFFEKDRLNFLLNDDKKIVAHYTSIDALYNIFFNEKIRFTDYKFLNDREEMNFGIRKIYECIGKLPKNDPFKIKISPKLKSLGKHKLSYSYYNSKFYKELDSNFYVLSNSIDLDNKDLWFYYSKDSLSRGYNIQFYPQDIVASLIKEKMNNLQKNDVIYKIINGKIIYEEEEQEKVIKEYIDKVQKLYSNLSFDLEKQEELIKIVLEDFLIFSLFMKSPYFRNEKEYRIVIALPKEKRKPNINPDSLYNIGNGYLKPSIELKISNSIFKNICISPYNQINIARMGLEDFVQYLELSTEIKESEITINY